MSASYLLWSRAQAEKCPEGQPRVTPLERRCRLLLRAYPAWYRRKRSEEILGTLLEASPPGRSWPSFRDARALVIGGLRIRGAVVGCMSILWAALGALGAGYIFILSTHVPEAHYIGLPSWVGEPAVDYLAGELGAMAWLLLTIPVLIAGLRRIRDRFPLTGWWFVAWVAGIALAFPVASWQPSAPMVLTCSKNQGCALAGYRYAVVSWGELAVFAGWLAVGAAMTLILARRARGTNMFDTRDVPAGQAGLT
jgi:hypothetical protein